MTVEHHNRDKYTAKTAVISHSNNQECHHPAHALTRHFLPKQQLTYTAFQFCTSSLWEILTGTEIITYTTYQLCTDKTFAQTATSNAREFIPFVVI